MTTDSNTLKVKAVSNKYNLTFNGPNKVYIHQGTVYYTGQLTENGNSLAGKRVDVIEPDHLGGWVFAHGTTDSNGNYKIGINFTNKGTSTLQARYHYGNDWLGIPEYVYSSNKIVVHKLGDLLKLTGPTNVNINQEYEYTVTPTPAIPGLKIDLNEVLSGIPVHTLASAILQSGDSSVTFKVHFTTVGTKYLEAMATFSKA